MNLQRITLEHGLYILAFAVALGVRMLQLGAAPLSEFEAEWALQAWQLSRGDQVTLGPNPGYVSLTGLTFFLMGSSNFFARFWPALAGSLLVWLPCSFRRQLGQKAAIVLAFGLAIDPGLVALSRLAGGPMLAIGFGLLALGLYHARLPLLSGITAGLAIMGGPAILQGAVGLGMAWVLGRVWVGRGARELGEKGEPSNYLVRRWKPLLISAGFTILLVGTLFLHYPQGLGALAGTIPAALSGWFQDSGIPVTRVLLAPLIYQPLALFFALFTVTRLWTDESLLPRWLMAWMLTALALALVFPGRQVGDVGWVLIPLWTLAAIEISCHLEINDWEKMPASGQAILLFLLLGLGWFNLSGLSLQTGELQTSQLRLLVIGGTIVLGGVTTLLVALGWSSVVAKRGLAWGVGSALGLYMLANMWGVSQLRANGEQELWSPPPATRQADLLIKTLGDLSGWHTGHRQTLDVFVTAPGKSIQWLLRDWLRMVFLKSIPSGELPSAIISTQEQSEPKLGVGYRGQGFSWSIFPAWERGLPKNWTRWMVFRDSPQEIEQLILWVRTDVFPSGSMEFLGDDISPSEIESPIDNRKDILPGLDDIK